MNNNVFSLLEKYSKIADIVTDIDNSRCILFSNEYKLVDKLDNIMRITGKVKILMIVLTNMKSLFNNTNIDVYIDEYIYNFLTFQLYLVDIIDKNIFEIYSRGEYSILDTIEYENTGSQKFMIHRNPYVSYVKDIKYVNGKARIFVDDEFEYNIDCILVELDMLLLKLYLDIIRLINIDKN